MSNDHKYFQYDDFTEKDEDQAPSPENLSNKVPVVDVKMFYTGEGLYLVARILEDVQ